MRSEKRDSRRNWKYFVTFPQNRPFSIPFAAKNIGGLLNRRDLYFVPFSQDDPEKKPRSMAANFGLCEAALDAALEGRQLQPIIL